MDWGFLFSNKTVNQRVVIFNQTVMNVSSNFVPNKFATFIDRDPVWMASNIKDKINYLNVLFRAYNLIIKRITRSAIIVEINTKDVKLVNTNILSLHSKRYLNVFCKCFLKCKDETLVFTNFTSLVLISTMIALLVILFIKSILTPFIGNPEKR